VNTTELETEEAGELVVVDQAEESYTLMNVPESATLTIVKKTTMGSGDDTFTSALTLSNRTADKT